MDEADKLLHPLDWVCDVFEEPWHCSDSMSIGFENGLWFHDKGGVTDTVEGSSGQELFNDPCNNFFLVTSLFFINKVNDSLLLVNSPILRV